MRAFEIVVVKPMGMSAKVRRIVRERDERNCCIACNASTPPGTKRKRLVCPRCFGRFSSHRPPKSQPIKRAKYDAQCEARGLVGPNCQGQRSDLDVYRDVAAKVTG